MFTLPEIVILYFIIPLFLRLRYVPRSRKFHRFDPSFLYFIFHQFIFFILQRANIYLYTRNENLYIVYSLCSLKIMLFVVDVVSISCNFLIIFFVAQFLHWDGGFNFISIKL